MSPEFHLKYPPYNIYICFHMYLQRQLREECFQNTVPKT